MLFVLVGGVVGLFFWVGVLGELEVELLIGEYLWNVFIFVRRVPS